MIYISDEMRKKIERVAERKMCLASFESCQNCILGFFSTKRCWDVAKEFLFFLDNQEKLYEKNEGYYVFNPNGDKPTYRHLTLDSAKTEAESLISLGINASEILILKIVDKAKVKKGLNWDVQDDTLPF